MKKNLKKVAIGVAVVGSLSLGGYAVNSHITENKMADNAVSTDVVIMTDTDAIMTNDVDLGEDKVLDNDGDIKAEAKSDKNNDTTEMEKSDSKEIVSIKTSTTLSGSDKDTAGTETSAQNESKSSAAIETKDSDKVSESTSSQGKVSAKQTTSDVEENSAIVTSSNNTTNTSSEISNTAQEEAPKTAVWHEPVYETQTVVEKVPKYMQVEITEIRERSICNNCGAFLYTQEDIDNHFNASHTGGYHNGIYYVGTGEYETVGDGYEEQTVTKQVLVQEGYWSYE